MHHLQRMSRIAEAVTEVALEGEYLIKQRFMAAATPFAVSACKTTSTPPPDIFLMQPKV
jgi:hypothetical protein